MLAIFRASVFVGKVIYVTTANEMHLKQRNKELRPVKKG